VLRYPALDEILALGFSFFPADDPDAVAEALRRPDAHAPTAARNRALAETHFSMDALVRSLEALLRTR
jgi:glycosyltransferase involved in cell wall biosynthesis